MRFPCKDCGTTFVTAKEFVDHIPACVPVSNLETQLEKAITFLRGFIRTNEQWGEQTATSLPDQLIYQKNSKLVKKVEVWLKANNLR